MYDANDEGSDIADDNDDERAMYENNTKGGHHIHIIPCCHNPKSEPSNSNPTQKLQLLCIDQQAYIVTKRLSTLSQAIQFVKLLELLLYFLRIKGRHSLNSSFIILHLLKKFHDRILV